MTTTTDIETLKAHIRDIPDFPKEGIVFKDITTLLNNKEAFRLAIDAMAEPFLDKEIQHIIGVEARGFLFGAALAYKLGIGFVPVRKKGKLPAQTSSITYDLEYGTDTLEIHEDAFLANERVLIVDDLLATGGTIRAVVDLVKKQHVEIVGVSFLVELTFLEGSSKLKDLPLYSVIKY